MRRHSLTLLCLVTFIATYAARADDIPKFSDYSVGEVFSGRNAPLRMTPEQRNFRTRLAAAARQPVNFAGHYVVAAWGCGTSCVGGAIYDAISGAVVDLPFSICCASPTTEDFRAIEFRPNSRLIIFAGLRNEREGDMGAHFYEFTGRDFRFLKTVPDDGSFSGGRRRAP